MTGPVSGDPASCSQLGGTLRQLATRLRAAGRAAHDAFDNGDSARPGPVVVQARRRVDLLDAAAAVAAREADRVGTSLQAHASDLAEAVAHGRLLTGRAEAAGEAAAAPSPLPRRTHRGRGTAAMAGRPRLRRAPPARRRHRAD